MNALIQKTDKLSGTALMPGSKSETIRGLVFGLLARGKSVLTNSLDSQDTKAAIKVCEDLGADIKTGKNRIIINSGGIPFKSKIKKINTGNSGITGRFILPVLGLRRNFDQPITLDCGEQMRGRPIKSLVNALNKLGMNVSYVKKRGACPLLVKGKLKGGKARVDGTTSQYLSALLISLPLAERGSEITAVNLRERPYVAMTLRWLDNFGIKYSHVHSGKTDRYKIKGKQTYKYFERQIPGDFSSASYLLAAGALVGTKVVLKGLDANDVQGDKKLLGILKKMGAKITVGPASIVIKKSANLKGIKIFAGSIPDLLPTLAVLGTQAKGKTEILDVKQARIKETDRIYSMTKGLRKMGAKIEEKKDGMIIHRTNLIGAKVRGYNDHRTVMALILAGMLANGKTVVTDADAVNKTFPEYCRVMKKLGANISLT